jgi:hypothetical protein
MTAHPRPRDALLCICVLLAGLATAGPARGNDNAANIPIETQTLIKARFRNTFLLPELVQWKFDFTKPYPTGGIAVCGRVNYQVSTRRYVGFRPFMALVVDGRVTDHRIVPGVYAEDPTYASLAAYKVACGTPPAPFDAH